MAANITEGLLSQFYTQKETGYELRQSGDTTHARKEVTTGKLFKLNNNILLIFKYAFICIIYSTPYYHVL